MQAEYEEMYHYDYNAIYFSNKLMLSYILSKRRQESPASQERQTVTNSPETVKRKVILF